MEGLRHTTPDFFNEVSLLKSAIRSGRDDLIQSLHVCREKPVFYSHLPGIPHYKTPAHHGW